MRLFSRDLSEAQKDTLEQNRLQNQRTTIEVDSYFGSGRVLSLVRSFTLRFFGPSSDQLTLRLVHRSSTHGSYFTVNEDGSYKHPIPHSDTLVLEDIKIWNTSSQHNANLSSELQALTFTPGTRNNLQFDVFQTGSRDYVLRDIELLGEDGLPYQPMDGRREGEDPGPSYQAGESSLQINPEAATRTRPGSH